MARPSMYTSIPALYIHRKGGELNDLPGESEQDFSLGGTSEGVRLGMAATI